MKIAFITNLCPSYRLKAFQLLVDIYNMDFYFYSRPDSAVARHLEIVKNVGKLRYLTSIQILKKLITEKHGLVIKCTNGKYITILSFLIAKLFRKKFIVWHTFWYNPQTFFRKISFPILKIILKFSDAVVVYGSHGKKYLESLGIDREKIFIAWQAVDNDLFKKQVCSEELNGICSTYNLFNKKVILFVGRLIEEKGLLYLIKATAKLNDNNVCLMVVGEGPSKDFLEDYCLEKGLKNIIFIGKICNSNLYAYYALADVFVLPSVTTKTFKEPWGLVVNEVMNQGTPVVVTDAVGAGVGGLVEEGVNGFVVPERDSQALSSALHKILYDDVLRKKMGESARQIIKEWTYEKMVKGFSDAIKYAQGVGK